MNLLEKFILSIVLGVFGSLTLLSLFLLVQDWMGVKAELRETQIKLREERLWGAQLEGIVIGQKALLKGYRLSTSFIVDLTSYTARPEETNPDYTNTAIMQEPIPGWTIAVSQDLRFLLGKRVYIPGYGVRFVNDLMNSRYSKRVDILVGSVSDARRIGIQKGVELILIEPTEALKEILEK